MANICGLNQVMKLQKLAIVASFSGLLQPRVITQFTKKFSVVQKSTTISLSTFEPSQFSLVGYSTIEGNPNRSKSIDEFRIQEEKREREYDQEEEEVKRETDGQPNEKVDGIRLQILGESLRFVSTHGWTRKAIAEGAEAIGYPGVAHGMFPEGGIELIRYFYNQCNEELVKTLRGKTKDGELPKEEPLEILTYAVKLRLQMIEPYISHWPQALAIMSLPQNAPKSLAQLLTLADDICYYSGDRSVDFGWYTRRVGLASIFKMTELYMLQDSSIDHQNTWNFLKKRMEEATQLESFLTQSDGITQNLQKTLSAAFVTARNMLGIGYNRN